MYKRVGLIGNECGEFVIIESVSLLKDCLQGIDIRKQKIKKCFCHLLLHGTIELCVMDRVCPN